jgi:hypothetical protein
MGCFFITIEEALEERSKYLIQIITSNQFQDIICHRPLNAIAVFIRETAMTENLSVLETWDVFRRAPGVSSVWRPPAVP